MHRLFLAGALCLTGCTGNIVGPFAPRTPQRVDDPCISIEEQATRGRDRLALPDESSRWMDNLAPRLYIDRPGPHDR